MDIAGNESKSSAALYLADAGLERVISVLSDTMTWRTGFVDEQLGKGTYSASLIDSTTKPFLGEKIIVRATGRINDISKNIEAYLRPVYEYPFTYGAYGRDSIVFGGNGSMDSYDSDLGTYVSQVNGSYADSNSSLGSLGGITLDGSTQIYGDVETATAGDFTFGGGVTVHGDTTSTANPPTYDCIAQSYLDSARVHSNSSSGLTFTGHQASYNNGTQALSVGALSSVTFSSGIYYFSQVDISSHGSLIIPDGVSVIIFVAGDWNSAGGTITNAGGIPSDFQVYAAGSAVNISGGSDFYGTFYAPCADVTITGGSDFYGSILGRSFNNGGGTNMHYDEATGRDVRGFFQCFAKEAWTEL